MDNVKMHTNDIMKLLTEVQKLRTRNNELQDMLRELHSKCLYQIHKNDDRVTHVEYGMFQKVEDVLNNKDF